MNVRWNEVTWYSKLIAVVLFVLVFLIGFWAGSAYQQKKYLASNPIEESTSTSSVAGNTPTANVPTTQPYKLPPAATHYNGLLICKSNSDCPKGQSCLVAGPIISGTQPPKVCVSSNQALPQ